MDVEEQSIVEEYGSSLEDLTFNSKPLINVLTMLAEENSKYAKSVTKLIEERIYKVSQSHKLPSLYLLDSIIKNVGGIYLNLIAQVLVKVFVSVFGKGDEKTRKDLYKLRHTWPQYFPAKVLHDLDVNINKLDPGWPITAVPPPSPSIHVNPKFLKKTEVTTPQIPVVIPDASKSEEKELLVEQRKRLAELQRLQEQQLRLTEQEIQEHQLKRDLILKKQEQERKSLLTQQQQLLLNLRLESELGESNEKPSETMSTTVSTKAEITSSIHSITTNRDPRLARQEQAPSHDNNNGSKHSRLKESTNSGINHSQPQDPRAKAQPSFQKSDKTFERTHGVTVPNSNPKRKSRSQSPLDDREKRLHRHEDLPKNRDTRPDPENHQREDRHQKRRRSLDGSESLSDSRIVEFDRGKQGPLEGKAYRGRGFNNRGRGRNGRPNKEERAIVNRGQRGRGKDIRPRGGHQNIRGKEVRNLPRDIPAKIKPKHDDKAAPDVVQPDRAKPKPLLSNQEVTMRSDDPTPLSSDQVPESPTIPQELTLEHKSVILEEAKRRLEAGHISQEQYIELIDKLAEFYELQRQQELESVQNLPDGKTPPHEQDMAEHPEVLGNQRGKGGRRFPRKRRLNEGSRHPRRDGPPRKEPRMEGPCQRREQLPPLRMERPGGFEGPPRPNRIVRLEEQRRDLPHEIMDGPSPMNRPGPPPMDKRSPLPTDRPGPPPMDKRGPLPTDRPGPPPMDRPGPQPLDRPGPPPMDRLMDRPPMDRQGPLPMDRQMDRPPMDRLGPLPMDRPMDRPPLDRQGPPPMDRPGLPLMERPGLPPMERPGLPPIDRPGPPPVDRPGPPPMDRPGPQPMDRPGPPPMDRPGPQPMDRPGPPPMDRPGPPPMDRPGPPPMDRLGPTPMDRRERLPPTLEHEPHSQHHMLREGQRPPDEGHPGQFIPHNMDERDIRGPNFRGGPHPREDHHPAPFGRGRPNEHFQGPHVIPGHHVPTVGHDPQMHPMGPGQEAPHDRPPHQGQPAGPGPQGPQIVHGGPHQLQPAPGQQGPGKPQGPPLGGLHIQHLELPAPGSPQRQGTDTPPPMPMPSTAPPTPSRMDKRTVDDLFSRLVQVGIIKVAEETPIHTPPRIGTPPTIPQPIRPNPIRPHPASSSRAAAPQRPHVPSRPQKMAPMSFQKLQEMIEKSREAATKIPQIELNIDGMKKRYSAIINMLYEGTQCSSCGLRFAGEAAAFYREHLDWHFRRNRREKDGRRIAHKQWYIPLKDWLEYEEITDPEEKAHSSFFDSTRPEMETSIVRNTQEGDGSCPVLPTDSEAESVCDICHEKFEQFWEETQEEWHYKEAIRVGRKTYHEVCYQDAKSNVEETTREAEANLGNQEGSSKDSPGPKKEEIQDTKKEVDSKEPGIADTVVKKEESIPVVKEEPKVDDQQGRESGKVKVEVATQKGVLITEGEIKVKTEVVETTDSEIKCKEENKDTTDDNDADNTNKNNMISSNDK